MNQSFSCEVSVYQQQLLQTDALWETHSVPVTIDGHEWILRLVIHPEDKHLHAFLDGDGRVALAVVRILAKPPYHDLVMPMFAKFVPRDDSDLLRSSAHWIIPVDKLNASPFLWDVQVMLRADVIKVFPVNCSKDDLQGAGMPLNLSFIIHEKTVYARSVVSRTFYDYRVRYDLTAEPVFASGCAWYLSASFENDVDISVHLNILPHPFLGEPLLKFIRCISVTNRVPCDHALRLAVFDINYKPEKVLHAIQQLPWCCLNDICDKQDAIFTVSVEIDASDTMRFAKFFARTPSYEITKAGSQYALVIEADENLHQTVYKVSSHPKGLALIINNFNSRNIEKVQAAEEDEKIMRETLEQLGYRVQVHSNLTATETMDVARCFVGSEDQNGLDSCVVVIFTEIRGDALLGCDGVKVDINDFLSCFSDDVAPALAGKPKIFIFQAITLFQAIEGDSDGDNAEIPALWFLRSMGTEMTRRSRPEQARAPIFTTVERSKEIPQDVLLVTLPPYSNRHTGIVRKLAYLTEVHRSPFILSACHFFCQSRDKSILEMLVEACRYVEKAYKPLSRHHMRIQSSLMQRFYFSPGVSSGAMECNVKEAEVAEANLGPRTEGALTDPSCLVWSLFERLRSTEMECKLCLAKPGGNSSLDVMAHLVVCHGNVHGAVIACEKWMSDVAKVHSEPIRHTRASDANEEQWTGGEQHDDPQNDLVKHAYFDAKELHLSGATQAAEAYLKVFELEEDAKGPTVWGFKAARHLTKSAIQEKNRDAVICNYLLLLAHSTAVTEDMMERSTVKIFALLAKHADFETRAIIESLNQTLEEFFNRPRISSEAVGEIPALLDGAHPVEPILRSTDTLTVALFERQRQARSYFHSLGRGLGQNLRKRYDEIREIFRGNTVLRNNESRKQELVSLSFVSSLEDYQDNDEPTVGGKGSETALSTSGTGQENQPKDKVAGSLHGTDLSGCTGDSVDSPLSKIASDVYKMSTSQKGLALVINNIQFYDGEKVVDERKGSDVDEEHMQELLKDLCYDVEVLKNLSATRMMEEAREFARKKEHKYRDSCVVVVFTHGRYGELIGSDCQPLDINKFLECFDGDKSPSLIGKPKFFIFQACRGGKHDKGVELADVQDFWQRTWFKEMRNRIVKGVSVLRSKLDEKKAYIIKWPTNADVLIAYSTVPNYVSWRDRAEGSWFIQSIYEVFRVHSARENVEDMLKMVHLQVAAAYEGKSETEANKGFKQIPCYESRLTRKFYLNADMFAN